MKKLNVLAIALLIVGLVAGFLSGMMYQKSQTSNNASRFAGANGQSRGRFGQNGGASNGGQRPVIGSIINQDQNSITVKLQDGSSKIILLSGTTAINKTDTGTVSDLKSGENVLVTGTTNSDGSVTAQNIQINPMFRRGGGGPQGSSRPQGSAMPQGY